MKTKFGKIAALAALLPALGVGSFLINPSKQKNVGVEALKVELAIENAEQLQSLFADGGDGVLHNDIEYNTWGSNYFICDSKTVNLDLNGHKITLVGTYSTGDNNYSFQTKGTGELHVYDSNPTGNSSIYLETGEKVFAALNSSKITLDNIKFTYFDNNWYSSGTAVTALDNAQIICNNCNIAGFTYGFRILGANASVTLTDCLVTGNITGGLFEVRDDSYLKLGKGTIITGNQNQDERYETNVVLDIRNVDAANTIDHIVFLTGDDAPTSEMKIGLTANKCDLISSTSDIRNRFVIDDTNILTYANNIIRVEEFLVTTNPTSISNFKFETNAGEQCTYQWCAYEEVTIDITDENFETWFGGTGEFHDVDDNFKSAFHAYIEILKTNPEFYDNFKIEFSTDVDVYLETESDVAVLEGTNEKYTLTPKSSFFYFTLVNDETEFTISDMKIKYNDYVPINADVDWVTTNTIDLTKVEGITDKTFYCVATNTLNPNAVIVSRGVDLIPYYLINRDNPIAYYTEDNANIYPPENPFTPLGNVVFVGWSLEPNGEILGENDVITIHEGTSFYARWGYPHCHNGSLIEGISFCEDDGFKDYYVCGCGEYFADSKCEELIEDLDAWKVGAGKVDPKGHVAVKHDAVAPTKDTEGCAEYYECSLCGKYFEDKEMSKQITDIGCWKAKDGGGYIEPLKANDDDSSLLWLWIVLPILLILIAVYLAGYFFLYRKGRLDEKSIKIIYKFLPRGEKEE